MAVAGVWFDVDGTLITYETSFQSIFEDAIGSVDTAIYDRYVEAVVDAISDGVTAPYRHAFEVTVETTALSGDPSMLAERYIDAEVAASTVAPGATTVLETAAGQGPVGVLTNGAGPVQRAKLTAHDLESLVDTVVVSGEYGVAKPDSALFERAADVMPAAEHVYVGDSIDDDVVGATAAGWDAILVTDTAHPGQDAAVATPRLTVESLHELEDRLPTILAVGE